MSENRHPHELINFLLNANAFFKLSDDLKKRQYRQSSHRFTGPIRRSKVYRQTNGFVVSH